MKKLSILLLLSGIAACSSVKTAFDFDRQADFTKFKTYSMVENNLVEAVGQLNSSRIIDAVETEMTAKGFVKSDDPDMLVNVYIKTQKKVDATAITSGSGYGYGPWRYGYAGGFSTTHINYNEYTEGTMFITFIDNATQKIIWQGTGTKTLNENANTDKREANITYVVKQILSQYPPKK